jgi:hypothetical protein
MSDEQAEAALQQELKTAFPMAFVTKYAWSQTDLEELRSQLCLFIADNVVELLPLVLVDLVARANDRGGARSADRVVYFLDVDLIPYGQLAQEPEDREGRENSFTAIDVRQEQAVLRWIEWAIDSQLDEFRLCENELEEAWAYWSARVKCRASDPRRGT